MANGQFSDQLLKCVECHSEFLWAASEQKFYQRMKFTPPKRCKPCRAKKEGARGKPPHR